MWGTPKDTPFSKSVSSEVLPPKYKRGASAGVHALRTSGRKIGRVSQVESKRPFQNWVSAVQFIEQSLGLLQIARVKALRKQAVHRSEQFASLRRSESLAYAASFSGSDIER